MTETIESPASAGGATTRMNMIQAINSALDVVMARDPDVVVMGEDVGYFGGVFRATGSPSGQALGSPAERYWVGSSEVEWPSAR